MLTSQSDGTLTGKFVVKDEGFYKIELTGPQGEQVDASPRYTIDVLKDQPPVVSFTKPGRDNSASPVEEVFVEAKANDDFGVKQPAADLLGERRRGEDHQAVRRGQGRCRKSRPATPSISKSSA